MALRESLEALSPWGSYVESVVNSYSMLKPQNLFFRKLICINITWSIISAISLDQCLMRIIKVDVIIMFIRVKLLCRKISQIDHRPIFAYAEHYSVSLLPTKDHYSDS